eukprot:617671-Amphidinium_carterae.1
MGAALVSLSFSIFGGGDDLKLPEAQLALVCPPNSYLHCVPGDGSCFFYCIQHRLLEFPSVEELRHLAECHGEQWAEASHIARLAAALSLRITVFPLEVSQARVGIDEAFAVHFGPPNGRPISVVNWFRDGA